VLTSTPTIPPAPACTYSYTKSVFRLWYRTYVAELKIILTHSDTTDRTDVFVNPVTPAPIIDPFAFATPESEPTTSPKAKVKPLRSKGTRSRSGAQNRTMCSSVWTHVTERARRTTAGASVCSRVMDKTHQMSSKTLNVERSRTAAVNFSSDVRKCHIFHAVRVSFPAVPSSLSPCLYSARRTRKK
jgi:hypothetical protein